MREITRESLLAARLLPVSVTDVAVRRISFEPGQRAGRHKHPCPVVGYVLEGTAVFQIEGEPVRELPAGSAFYEPAGAVIARFDNWSSSAAMKFVAFYLLSGRQELIEWLPEE